MALASKEMAEKKKQSERKTNNTDGVVITVYEESVTTRSTKLSEDPNKTTKPNPHFRRPRAAGTHGYDRRALLLSHARKLRNAVSQKLPLPTNQSRPKIKTKKGIWLTRPVRICSGESSIEMPPSSSNQSRGKNSPSFLSKMKNTLKQLSCKEI